MRKGKVTLECSCGNSKSWLILANVIAVDSGRLKNSYKYRIRCWECGAEKTLGIKVEK